MKARRQRRHGDARRQLASNGIASRVSVRAYREEMIQLPDGSTEKAVQYAVHSLADAESGVATDRTVWVRFSEIVELHNNVSSAQMSSHVACAIA